MDEKALSAVRDEWNKAEKAVKLAEQVNGEIVNPAIYELRYAGRRLVEALVETDEEKVKKLLGDAHFDCCRARHDAIDAATSKIIADLTIAIKKLGPNNVLSNFPEFSTLFADLSQVRSKIATSRERRDDRDAIYQAIEDDNLAAIIDRYNRFQACEPLLKETAKRDRRGILAGRISLVIGLASLALGFLAWQSAQPSQSSTPAATEVVAPAQ